MDAIISLGYYDGETSFIGFDYRETENNTKIPVFYYGALVKDWDEDGEGSDRVFNVWKLPPQSRKPIKDDLNTTAFPDFQLKYSEINWERCDDW